MSERTIGDWIKTFWWLQGVATAMSLVAVLNSVLELKQTQYLAFIHRILVDWNRWMSCIGNVLGRLPFVTELSPEQTNLLFLVSISMFPVIAHSFFFQHQYLLRLRENATLGDWVEATAAVFMSIFTMLLVVVAFVLPGALDGGMVWVCVGGFVLYCFMANQRLGKFVFITLSIIATLEIVYLTDTVGAGWLHTFVCSGAQPAPHCEVGM